jgi:hypothetical protein
LKYGEAAAQALAALVAGQDFLATQVLIPNQQ